MRTCFTEYQHQKASTKVQECYKTSKRERRAAEDEESKERRNSQQHNKCLLAKAAASWFIPPDIICAACSLSWGNWQKEKHKKKKKSQPKLLQETRDPQSSGQTVPAFARLFRSERVQGPCAAPLSMAVLARESVPSGLQHTHAQTTAALYSPCSGVAAKHLPEHLLISASGIGHIFAQ